MQLTNPQIEKDIRQLGRILDELLKENNSGQEKTIDQTSHFQDEIEKFREFLSRNKRLSGDMNEKTKYMFHLFQETLEKLANWEHELQNRSEPEKIFYDTKIIMVRDENFLNKKYDVFISHATEDKEELVRPLAIKLAAKHIAVWYDEFTLKVGDSLRRSIDSGLINSRFGIVVLSPSFFRKNWSQYELDGLVAKEQSGRKTILPLWHRVTKDDVLGFSPSLADKVALSTSIYSIDELAEKLTTEIIDVKNRVEEPF